MTADQLGFGASEDAGGRQRPARARQLKKNGKMWRTPSIPEACERPPEAPQSASAAALAAIVARDIVPALMTEFAALPRHEDREALGRNITRHDRAVFAASILSVPTSFLVSVAVGHLQDGVAVERVLLDLLTPTARHLGVLWEQDEITFVDVTIAVQKLQHVLRVICDQSPIQTVAAAQPTAYIAPVPGEVHTFGLVVLGELLRARGWRVQGGMPAETKVITESICADETCGLVGLSLSQEALLKTAASLITKLRRRTNGRKLTIIAGGRVFEGRQGLAADIGADGAFADGAEAAAYLDQLTPGQQLAMPR